MDLHINVFVSIVTAVFMFLSFIWTTRNFFNLFLKILFFCLAFWGAAITWVWLTGV